MRHKISAILLAAGLSKRMGQTNKLLMDYKGQPMILHTVTNIMQANIDELIVVIGHQQEEINHLLEPTGVRTVVNKAFDSGMTSSIQTGVSAADAGSIGYLVCLADMPKLDSLDYSLIADRSRSTSDKRILRPSYENQPGHPIYFSKHFKQDLLNHSDPTGCRGVISDNLAFLEMFKYPNNHILIDFDTLEDFRLNE